MKKWLYSGDNVAPEADGKWSPLLLFVCVATTIGTAVPVGWCLGVMNTPAEFIKTWCDDALILRYDLHLSASEIDVLWFSIVSALLLGGIVGSFIGASCSNTFGRKGCMQISAALLTLSGLLFSLCRIANSVEMLLLGRLLAGIAAALIYTANPMYLIELAPVALRGFVGVFTGVGVTCGIFVGQIFSLRQLFGTEAQWPYALSFYAVLVVGCYLPSFYFFPESPRWMYLVKQDYKSAEVALRRLRSNSSDREIREELVAMQADAQTAGPKMGLLAVLRSSELLLPLLLVCSFQACQQLSGINAIFYYSVPIFTKAGFSSENAEWMNLGAGALNVCIALLGPVLMTKFRRRPLMLLSSGGCCLTLFAVAFTLNYIDYISWLAPACIALLAAFIVFFNLGLGPMGFIMGSVLFEVAPRSAAMSMGSLFSWTGNFMIGMFFPMMQSACGSFAFLPCSLICLYGFLLSWRFFPESRGRDATYLKPLMANGFKSKIHE